MMKLMSKRFVNLVPERNVETSAFRWVLLASAIRNEILAVKHPETRG